MWRRPGCSISATRGVEEKHPRPLRRGSGGSVAWSLGSRRGSFSPPPITSAVTAQAPRVSETRRREARFLLADPTPKVKGIRSTAFPPSGPSFSPHVTQDDPEGTVSLLLGRRAPSYTRRVPRLSPRKASSFGRPLLERCRVLVLPVVHALACGCSSAGAWHGHFTVVLVAAGGSRGGVEFRREVSSPLSPPSNRASVARPSCSLRSPSSPSSHVTNSTRSVLFRQHASATTIVPSLLLARFARLVPLVCPISLHADISFNAALPFLHVVLSLSPFSLFF